MKFGEALIGVVLIAAFFGASMHPVRMSAAIVLGRFARSIADAPRHWMNDRRATQLSNVAPAPSA